MDKLSFIGETLKADPQTRTFSGYAAVFGKVDDRPDVLAVGCFDKTLAEYQTKKRFPRLLWQHRTEYPIGVVTALSIDGFGLKMAGRLTAGVSKAEEAYNLMKDGAIDSMSIGFWTDDDDYDRETGVRTIKRVALQEISVVTEPAREDAKILDVQSRRPQTIRSFEEGLRKHLGFSRTEAEQIARYGFKANPRDEDADRPDPRDGDGRLEKILADLQAANRIANPA